VDDFDYLPEYGWPAEEPPYGRYTDSGTAPMGRHRGPGQPDYPPTPSYGGPEYPQNGGRRAPGRPPQGPVNGGGYPPSASGPMRAYQQPNGRPAPGYPPPGNAPAAPYPPYNGSIQAYRPNSGPTQAYRPGDSGPMRAYQPGASGPMRAYQPGNSGPMQAYQPEMQGYEVRGYRPDMSGPVSAYRPNMSGPMPAYQQPNGRPPAGYPQASTGLLSEPPVGEPTRAYQPSAEFPDDEPIRTYQPPAERRTPPRSSANGKEILGWLPFGNRLVLVPKDLGDDEEDLREHRDVGDGWLRPAVFGAMDGLVTNVSLIAGVGAGSGMGSGARSMIILTGIAGLIAGAFSMATGEFISVSSQNELNLAEVELERKQHARDPQGKLRRLAHLFVEKGVSPNLAEAVVRQISADPERAVEAHLREELGIDPDDLPSPRTAAIASLASFTVGALIPLAPFLLGDSNLKLALALSGAAAFIGGAAVAKLTGRPMLLGGLRQLIAAALGAGAAFGIGHAIGTHVS
jgi:vacuolar iron transporter family protein